MALLVEHGDGLVEVADALQPHDVADGLVAGQELGELGDAAVEAELLLGGLLAPAVAHRDREPGDQEGGLPRADVDLVERDLGLAQEDLAVDPPAHARAGDLLGEGAAVAQAGLLLELGGGAVALEDAGHAATEAHLVDAPAKVDLDVEPGGQGVDHGGADAVQAAGGAVGPATELAAGVELGEDELDAHEAALGLDVDGDAAAVVTDLDGPVGEQLDLDALAEAGESLVDGVVHDLPEAVHETAAVSGPDVHSGALTDGLQALQHRQMTGRVTRLRADCRHSHSH